MSVLLCAAACWSEAGRCPTLRQRISPQSYSFSSSAQQFAGKACQNMRDEKKIPLARRNMPSVCAHTDSSRGLQPVAAKPATKMGNVWRSGVSLRRRLCIYLLQAFGILAFQSKSCARAAGVPIANRNAGAKTAYEFTLRRCEDGAPFPLLPFSGKVSVVNLSGPPGADLKLAAGAFPRTRKPCWFLWRSVPCAFSAQLCDDRFICWLRRFFAIEQPKINTYFADGLDRLLAITSFPTVLVIAQDARGSAFRPEALATMISGKAPFPTPFNYTSRGVIRQRALNASRRIIPVRKQPAIPSVVGRFRFFPMFARDPAFFVAGYFCSSHRASDIAVLRAATIVFT